MRTKCDADQIHSYNYIQTLKFSEKLLYFVEKYPIDDISILQLHGNIVLKQYGLHKLNVYLIF